MNRKMRKALVMMRKRRLKKCWGILHDIRMKKRYYFYIVNDILD